MRHLLDINQLSVGEIDALISTATDMMEHPARYADACRGKKLTTLFFEPSTRTRLSFEAAMHELGGEVLSVPGASLSSAAKGESMADTIRVLSCFSDIVAMRTPEEGSPLVAALYSGVPVINAGDGGHNHPTQTLADLCTVQREMGRLDHLTVGLCGDLKYGRTVHSLINAMSRYEGVRFVLISPRELVLPDYVRNVLEEKKIPYEEVTDLTEAMPSLDILYMTRIQRERFTDPGEYERLKNSYILDPAKMEKAKKKMIVMHPLPRVNEISVAVDADPRACYFQQVLNGKYMRAALIMKLLAEKDLPSNLPLVEDEAGGKLICRNSRCITNTEQELPQRFRRAENGIFRCVWCEAKG